MNIDWSKAPPEAIGAMVAQFDSSAAGGTTYMGKVEFVCSRDERRAFREGEDCWEWHEKPSTPPWSGEGLPPVGIEIEAMLPALGSARFWQIAKVVHGPLPESPGEILVFSLENTKPSWVDQFRPIRTPEQIAAEERESELNRMVATVSMLDKGWARKVCAGLYDAGYRKQVQP